VRDFCGITCNTRRTSLERSLYSCNCSRRLGWSGNQARLLLQDQKRSAYQLENAITEGSVLDRDALSRGFAAIADAFVSRLMAASEIPRSVQEDLLKDLASWPLVLEETAYRQTRFPRGGNGKRPDEDASGTTSARRRRLGRRKAKRKRTLTMK
jgi:hypothetical protein